MKKNRLSMIRTISFGALVIIGSGCGGLTKFPVAIDSDPQGARIEVNNSYIGETPVTYTVEGNGDRSFNGNWVQGPMIVFVATPPNRDTNLFVVSKAFHPSAFFQQGDHIPEKMFFDLRRKPDGLMLNFSPDSKQ